MSRAIDVLRAAKRQAENDGRKKAVKPPEATVTLTLAGRTQQAKFATIRQKTAAVIGPTGKTVYVTNPAIGVFDTEAEAQKHYDDHVGRS